MAADVQQPGSEMERFIRSFLTLDKNQDECVDKKELEAYCAKNKMDPSSIEKWMGKLDADKNGKISLSEFCRGFGLKISEMRLERGAMTKSASGEAPKIADDIQIIATTMPEAKQFEITEKFKELMKKGDGGGSAVQNVAKELKEYLEENYGRVWQVVVLSGSYWMNFAHEPFQSIQFRYDQYIGLLWRTPSS